MTKYTTDFRIEVVLFHEQQGRGARFVADHFGIDRALVRRWVAAFRQHGVESLKICQHRRHYDLDFKLKVLRFLDKVGSIRQTCAHFNIPTHATILTWQRRYASGGIDALLPRPQGRRPMKKPPKPTQKPSGDMTPEEMAEELAYLRAENAYLKKLDALIQKKRLMTQDKKPKSSKG